MTGVSIEIYPGFTTVENMSQILPKPRAAPGAACVEASPFPAVPATSLPSQ